MNDEEKRDLQTAILTICDPRGNWHYGWAMICNLAGVETGTHPAPFRERTEEQLRQLGEGTSTPPMPRIPPPKSE